MAGGKKDEAVTMREHVLATLSDAAPEGLPMAAIVTEMAGRWTDDEVREVVRKLWQSGEVKRREDATFVATGVAGRDGRYRMTRARDAEARLDEAIRRIGQERGGINAPLRTRRVDPALLRP